jgi:amino acid permease
MVLSLAAETSSSRYVSSVTLKTVLLIILVLLMVGGVAAFALIATGPIFKLLSTRMPGLIAYDRKGRARWSGTIPSDELSTTTRRPENPSLDKDR